MPVCTGCGTWNQDAAKRCEKCGSAIQPTVSAAGPAALLPSATLEYPAAAVSPPASGLPDRRRQRFYQFGALLIFSVVAAMLLGRSSYGRYDSSAPGVLDENYTQETKTDRGGVKTITYDMTYKFMVKGTQYTGKDGLSSEPTTVDTTVYYMAGNPQENALAPSRSIGGFTFGAGAMFVIAVIAYWMIPKNYLVGAGNSSRNVEARVGDFEKEHLAMKHGKYSAWMHVHLAFLLQVALVGYLIALGLALAAHTEITGYAILGIAAFVSAATTLWVYADRWSCIEAVSSRSCSGLANLSFLYVPVVAFVYANYRGLRKLQGR
jgi:hypothetical protein